MQRYLDGKHASNTANHDESISQSCGYIPRRFLLAFAYRAGAVRYNYKWLLETNVKLHSYARCEPTHSELSTRDWIARDASKQPLANNLVLLGDGPRSLAARTQLRALTSEVRRAKLGVNGQ